MRWSECVGLSALVWVRWFECVGLSALVVLFERAGVRVSVAWLSDCVGSSALVWVSRLA